MGRGRGRRSSGSGLRLVPAHIEGEAIDEQIAEVTEPLDKGQDLAPISTEEVLYP